MSKDKPKAKVGDRVTRAQAEAAMRRIDAMSQELDELGEEHGDERLHRLCGSTAGEIEVVRAYIAQRPDEETIRKGYEALDELCEKWRGCCAECCDYVHPIRLNCRQVEKAVMIVGEPVRASAMSRLLGMAL